MKAYALVNRDKIPAEKLFYLLIRKGDEVRSSADVGFINDFEARNQPAQQKIKNVAYFKSNSGD